MSDLGNIYDAGDFLALLGEKSKGIEVAWVEALVAVGVTLSFRPLEQVDIERAFSSDIEPLFPTDPFNTATSITLWQERDGAWVKLGNCPSIVEAREEMDRLAKGPGTWKAISTGPDLNTTYFDIDDEENDDEENDN
jgi:hypothetical protein